MFIPIAFLSANFCLLYNVMLWNISFPGWYFLAFCGLYQKRFSCCQPWWRSLVNTSLISQFLENVNSFNFLATPCGENLRKSNFFWYLLPNTKPKFHFPRHYTEMIKRFVPFAQTLWFEAKHQNFKRASKKNFHHA